MKTFMSFVILMLVGVNSSAKTLPDTCSQFSDVMAKTISLYRKIAQDCTDVRVGSEGYAKLQGMIVETQSNYVKYVPVCQSVCSNMANCHSGGLPAACGKNAVASIPQPNQPDSEENSDWCVYDTQCPLFYHCEAPNTPQAACVHNQ